MTAQHHLPSAHTTRPPFRPDAHCPSLIDTSHLTRLLSPEVILPTQQASPKWWTRYHELWAAVLCQALDDCLNASSGRLLRREARVWLMSDDTRLPFCYLAICELLRLDPAAVRDVVCRYERLHLRWRGATAQHARCLV